MSALVCFVVSIIRGAKKLFGRKVKAPMVADEVLNHAKRIVKTSEYFYKSASSKSSSTISKADITLDITAYCLYHTFKVFIHSGYSSKDAKIMIKTLTKHISFYIENDVSFSDLYMKHFMLLTDLLGIDSTEEKYKSKMTKYLINHYSLKLETSILENTMIEKIDTFIRTDLLIKALR